MDGIFRAWVPQGQNDSGIIRHAYPALPDRVVGLRPIMGSCGFWSRHYRVLLCAADIAATEASLVMAGRFARSVPVRDTVRFEQEPRRSLFDGSAAAGVLGWEPRYQRSTRGAYQAG